MASQRANFIFAQAHFAEWTAHAKFAPGFASRPKVARVFGVKAIKDSFESTLPREAIQSSVNVLFTKIATVDWIRGVARIFNFVRFDLDVRNPYLIEKAKCISLFVLTQAGRNRNCGKHVVTT